MSSDFATVLDECLDRLKSGDSVSTCLESYPEHAEDLEPLLETAQFAEALRFTEPPRLQALARGRQRFLTEAVRLREQQQVKERSLPERVRDLFTAGAAGPLWGRTAAVIVVALLLFGALGGVVVQASESSLPGDPLYSIKQVTRQVQLLTTMNREVREAKEKQIQAKEREEVRQATQQGRVFEEDVAGVILEWDGRSLVLEGDLRIQVADTTQIPEQPIVGRVAQVHVRSEHGRLVAERIAIRQIVLVMAVTETATATHTATVEPTETPRPTNTPEPTKPPPTKVVPTDTPKPKVTDTPLPRVTEEPVVVIHIFELAGAIEFISESLWVVAGQEIQVTPDTIIKGGSPAVGHTARVLFNRFDDGTRVAVEIEVETANTPTPAKVFLSGVVESQESDTVLFINNQRVRMDDRTEVVGDLKIGAFVDVEGLQESETTVFAEKITVVRTCENSVLFEGVIHSIDAEAGVWVVDGFTISVDSDTVIQGTAVVGAVAQVEACRVGDKSLAQRIFVLPTPTPTSTPIVTPTPEPASLQSTPTVGAGVTVTPSPEAFNTPTLTIEPSPTVTDTATTEPSPTVMSTPPSDATPTVTPDG
ncbi:MAG: DUF5666 domain-containing protein [Anaerolineae bacterium]